MTPEAKQRHDDLGETVSKLSNGGRGDPLVMSDGIVNISKTLQVILASNYVTYDTCKRSHDKIMEDISGQKFGWKALAAVFAGCSTLFGLGYKLIDTIWAGKEDVSAYIMHTVDYFV